MTNLIPLTEDAAAVIVPKESSRHYINGYKDHVCYSIDPFRELHTIMLPPGQWEIVSRASVMTVEQWGSVVEDCPYYAKCWKHYQPTNSFINAGSIHDPNISCWTRTESGHSLLASKGIYLKNPLGEKPKLPNKHDCETWKNDACNVRLACCFGVAQFKLQDWESAQSKVSDPIIIRKIK